MLQGDAGPAPTAWVVFKALVAIGMCGAAAIGYLKGPLVWWERIVAFVAATLLVTALLLTEELGLAAVVLFVAWHLHAVKVRARTSCT